MRNGLNLGGLPDRFIRYETPLRVDKVGRENCIDQRRLAEPSLTCI